MLAGCRTQSWGDILSTAWSANMALLLWGKNKRNIRSRTVAQLRIASAKGLSKGDVGRRDGQKSCDGAGEHSVVFGAARFGDREKSLGVVKSNFLGD